MINNFQYWLESIVEDNPIPYEIKHICFICSQNGKILTLSMGGCELKPTQNNMFDYYPLEAQFYFDRKLFKITNQEYYKKLVKDIIDESFSSYYLKYQFNGKSIYFGTLNGDLEFLFSL